MIKRSEYRGLCSTCDNTEHCALRPNREKPAVFCEQFDSEGARPREALSEPPRPSAQSARAAREETGFIGLCADCQGRVDCSLSNADGGVWHCEEYR